MLDLLLGNFLVGCVCFFAVYVGVLVLLIVLFSCYELYLCCVFCFVLMRLFGLLVLLVEAGGFRWCFAGWIVASSLGA